MSETELSIIAVSISLAGIGLAALALLGLRQSERRLRAVRLQILGLRLQLQTRELNKTLIAENAKLVARGIDQGSLFIEKGHRVVSEVTFGLLQLFPATRGRAQQIKETHNAISQGIYGAFREINRQVGGSIAEGIKNAKSPGKNTSTGLIEKRRRRKAKKARSKG